MQSPLFLSLFSTVLPPLPIVWALSDIVGACALLRIWHARQRVGKSSGGRDGLVAAVSLLNPYLLLPSLAMSTSTFENTAVLLTLMFASEGEFAQLSKRHAFTHILQENHRQPFWLSRSRPISPYPRCFCSSRS